MFGAYRKAKNITATVSIMATPASTSDFKRRIMAAGLSETGADWALLAVDAFHDTTVPIVGLPDGQNGRSVVHNVRKQLTISKPSWVTATDQWDAHIAFLPAVTATTTGVTPNGVKYTYDRASASYGLFGSMTTPDAVWADPGACFVVCKVASGEDTFNATAQTNPPEYQTITVASLVDDVRARLIAGGYEVHNTTDELHKGGVVTDYCVDDTPVRGSMVFQEGINQKITISGSTQGSVTNVAITGYLASSPPLNIAIAKQINGVTREAREGSYVMLKIDDQSFPMGLLQPGPVVYRNHCESGKATKVDCGIITWLENIQGPDATPSGGFCASRALNYLQCGSYYAGMNAESTLDLSVNLFVEEFPFPGEDIMDLASPSPPLDLAAIQLVSLIQSETLPGCPVGDNGIGAFFQRVLNTVKEIVGTGQNISKQLALVPGPVGNFAQGFNEAANHGFAITNSVEKLAGMTRRQRGAMNRKARRKRNGRK